MAECRWFERVVVEKLGRGGLVSKRREDGSGVGERGEVMGK